MLSASSSTGKNNPNNPSDLKTISVEAEGIGETKLKALNAAWMEAVRKAVGMVMVGKQEAINDALTEQIVTHSRGQINSYKVLNENNSDGIWTVNILANIDRDILQETVGTSKTSTMAFDGTSSAAKKNINEQKQKSSLMIVKEALALLNPEDWIECKSSIHQFTGREGKEEFYTAFLLYPNLKNYKIQADQAEKLISRIASSVEDAELDIAQAKSALDLIKHPTFDTSRLPTSVIADPGKGSRIASFYSRYTPNNAICFFKNVGSMRCYKFENKDISNYINSYHRESLAQPPSQPTYLVKLTVEAEESFDGFLGQRTWKLSYPNIKFETEGNSIYITPSIDGNTVVQVNVPLNLTDEQLVSIKEIKGECTISPLKR